MPINTHLQDLGAKVDAGKSVDWDKEGKKVDEYVRKWGEKHTVRFINFAGAWATGLAVSVLSL